MSAPSVEGESYYEVASLLGEGGMGRVFRAVHRPTGRVVALKTLHPRFAREGVLRRMLLDEATAAARLTHPNVVRMLDLGERDDGTPFLVMELIEGSSLASAMRTWPGWPAVAKAIDGVLEGLAAAHAAGILHRDLKLDNVLVDPEGHAHISDFGIAMRFDPRVDAAEGRRVAGTPIYMAPEQFCGEPATPATDLYALGGMLFELLTGTEPFSSELSMMGLYAAKEEGPPTMVPRPGLQLPSGLSTLVTQLLSPRPQRRPRFARAVRDALRALGPRVVDVVSRGRAPDAQTALAATLEQPRLGSVRQTSLGWPPEPARAPNDPARPTEPAPEEPPRERFPASSEGATGASLARLRDTPLVGRERECAELAAELDAVLVRGGTRVVLLVGGVGSGKSKLARWILEQVERRGCMDSTAAAFEATGATDQGLRHAMRRLLGEPGPSIDDGIAPGWRPLHEAGASRDTLEALAEWLVERPRREVAPARAASLGHQALRAASRVRPVLLWLDEVGWSSDGTVDMLEQLVEAQDADVLVVATIRDGAAEHPRWAERLEALRTRAAVRTIALPALDDRALEALLASLVPMSPPVAAALAKSLGGTALLAVQLVHDWLDAGVLVAGERGYAPAPGLTVDALVASRPIAALLARRIETVVASLGALGPVADAAVVRAALLGERFELEPLRRSLGARAAQLDAVLDRALMQGLLRSDGPGAYRFAHGTLHDAALARADALPPDVAARARREVAAALLAFYGESSHPVSARAGWLSFAAGDRERALALLGVAAVAAAREGDAGNADAYLVQWDGFAAALSGERAAERAAERASLTAHASYYLLRYDDALRGVAEARGLCAKVGDRDALARLAVLEALVLLYLGRLREADACVRAALASQQAPLAPADRLRALACLAELAVTRGDLGEARTCLAQCLALSGDAGSSLEHYVLASVNLAEVHMVRGELAEAEQLLRGLEARFDAEKSGAARRWRRELDESNARLALLRGDAARALERAERGLEQAQRRGDAWRATALHLLVALSATTLGLARAEGRTRALLLAYAAVPQDEAFTHWGFVRLAALHRERGEGALADELDALRRAKLEEWERGWLGATLAS